MILISENEVEPLTFNKGKDSALMEIPHFFCTVPISCGSIISSPLLPNHIVKILVPFIYPTPSFICDPLFFFPSLSLLHSLAPLCVGVQILKYEWITPKKLLLKFEVNSKSSRESERKERERKQIMLHYSSTHSDLLFNSSSSPCSELRLSSHW